jgi:ABC-type transport system involved in multi-copper enzyme maturation permease subunit
MTAQPTHPPLHQPVTATSTGELLARRVSEGSRSQPFIAVLSWELRRVLASRTTWVAAALMFGVCLVLLRASPQSVDWLLECCSQRPNADLISSWTTLWGLACVLPSLVLLVGLFVPFVAADGVARDLRRHTHELLMTTPLPTWAYVFGRYMAGILLCLGLAVLLLLAICMTAVAQHVLQPSIHPWVDLPGTVVVWAIFALPPIIVLGSFSFALGTLLPRRSNLVKGGALVIWFAIGVMLPQFVQYRIQVQEPRDKLALPWYAAYVRWDPISSATETVLKGQFFHQVGNATLGNPALSNRAFFQRLLPVARQMPDLGLYAGPHLAWIAIGLAAGIGSFFLFHRFRDADM